MRRTIVGLAGAAAAAVVWLTPGLAMAGEDRYDGNKRGHDGRHQSAPKQPVAAAFMYEVAEGLSFKAPKRSKDPEDAKRRLADATLLGKKVVPLTADPASPWAAAQFISADAQSNVSLTTGSGPIRGTFDLLQDLDPTRESLDTLVISASGSLHGVLDISTAMHGYATTSGTWQIKRSPGGTFAGVFLIPFPIGPGLYAYLDLTDALQLDKMGLSLCDNPILLPVEPAGTKACVLGSDEYALGIPLTKAVLILFQ